jgi:ribonuclease PH
MTDIDEILKMLRTAETPEKLLQMDGAMLAAIGEARNASVIAATLALFIGVASTALPTGSAQAAAVAPFALATPLAPSTLLTSQ